MLVLALWSLWSGEALHAIHGQEGFHHEHWKRTFDKMLSHITFLPPAWGMRRQRWWGAFFTPVLSISMWLPTTRWSWQATWLRITKKNVREYLEYFLQLQILFGTCSTEWTLISQLSILLLRERLQVWVQGWGEFQGREKEGYVLPELF